MGCLLACYAGAVDATFVMSDIFDGSGTSATVTTPVAASISTNGSKSNAKDGKLGSDGNYFQIVLSSNTFNAVSINGYINTNNTEKNWAFQFSTDGGSTWSTETTQANDGNKSAHDVAVGVTIPSGANGFRVVRRAGTSTVVKSITLSLDGGTPPTLSSDASLSELKYSRVSVPNFSPTTYSYDIMLRPEATNVPTVEATANDPNATVVITPAASLPGTTTVTVTAQDGTTTQTYTINFTVAESNVPYVNIATWPNMQFQPTIDIINHTITGQVKHGTGLTAITPTFSGRNIDHWTPQGAQDFSQGPVEYTFSSPTGEAVTYEVTITEAPQMSSDATLSSFTYDGIPVPNFRPDMWHYQIDLPAGTTQIPELAGVPNDPKATMVVVQALQLPGTGNIQVTAEDGTRMVYSVTFIVAAPTPETPLTLHVPDIYQASTVEGGYNTPLTVVNGREYEVYYINRDNDNLSVATTNVDKAPAITTSSDKQDAAAKDGWFTIATSTNHGGDTNASAQDEFKASIRSISMKNEDEIVFHVQGYDQFSFYGKDNGTDKDKYFHVYIDDVLQTTPAPNTGYAIRRYDMTAGEHVIRIAIKKSVTSSSKFCSFSLRVGQEPRTKWLKGNDSTQVVLQTTAIQPVTYVTKYNNIPGAQTRLVWIGQEAKGIELQQIRGTIADTLLLSGNANCPVGEYHYEVIAYYNGKKTNSVTGAFKVKSDIQATSDVKVDVYQNEEMDEVTFKYYALSADDVQLTWTGVTPDGIFGSGEKGKYVIGGTPTTTGVYPFEITVLGADTVIKGQITVQTLDYGDNAVLYLYKNNFAYEKDGVYKYLTSMAGGKHNIIARKAKENGLRPAEQYANYKWVIVSEDVDADNAEVLAVVRGASNLPVLNLKGFTYSPDRLNWGEPDNGAIDTAATKKQGCAIVIEQASHPIFKYNTTAGAGIQLTILSSYVSNGVMPIAITNAAGTLCLATAYTRNMENYYGLGALQTAIHEVPADMRGGKKYICLPIGRASQLSTNGEYLVKGIAEYLLSPDQATIVPPVLEIRSFTVAGQAATIDQEENTITLRLTEEQFESLDSLRDVKPEIILADQTTHVLPNGQVNLQYMYILPKTFVVTDYINRRTYEFNIDLYDPTQGIDEVYESGMWVNVYDIYGRKVATTNENIYTMELPHGMYIIVLENGQTLKIMR